MIDPIDTPEVLAAEARNHVWLRERMRLLLNPGELAPSKARKPKPEERIAISDAAERGYTPEGMAKA